MDVIQEAVDRANAARKKSPKYEAVGLDNPGWLTLRFIKLDNPETVEGMYFQQQNLLLTKLGQTKEGKIRVFEVFDKELRAMARAAMVEMRGHYMYMRSDLIEATHAIRAAKTSSRTKGSKKVQRKSPERKKK